MSSKKASFPSNLLQVENCKETRGAIAPRVCV